MSNELREVGKQAEHAVAADPGRLESGLTLNVDGTVLWANLSYIECSKWRRRIWDMTRGTCLHSHTDIRVVSAVFPAET